MCFKLFTFPTKKHPEKRQLWVRKFNRADPKKQWALKEPSQSHRVCSRHFVDGKPTETHPHPELFLTADNDNVVPEESSTSNRYIISPFSKICFALYQYVNKVADENCKAPVAYTRTTFPCLLFTQLIHYFLRANNFNHKYFLGGVLDTGSGHQQ